MTYEHYHFRRQQNVTFLNLQNMHRQSQTKHDSFVVESVEE